MHATRFLISTAAALAVVSVVGLAYAQGSGEGAIHHGFVPSSSPSTSAQSTSTTEPAAALPADPVAQSPTFEPATTSRLSNSDTTTSSSTPPADTPVIAASPLLGEQVAKADRN
jgi:hypothetical protein